MSLDLDALEESFDLVAAQGDALMDSFYARLFDTAPTVKPLFAGTDLRRQKGMLLGALVLLRKSLRDLDAIVPKLRELGARHVSYGAQPAHYRSSARFSSPRWRRSPARRGAHGMNVPGARRSTSWRPPCWTAPPPPRSTGPREAHGAPGPR